MARIPTPRSWNAIVGDMVNAFLSRLGLKSLKIGSPVLTIIEAAAQSDLRSSQDIFNLLNARSLDRAEGVALDRAGADEDLLRFSDTAASGTVSISDTSFLKISSKVFQGLPAPIVGSDTLFVTDASLFPATGKVFIGRGTTNYEGPLAYSAKANNGTYWTLTLTDLTRRFHNQGETVIVAQGGNRSISAGVVVQTPQGNSSDATTFSTMFSSTIPDGEVLISGVKVIAQVPGVSSNVPAGAISAFGSLPFPGAAVTNLLPFTNGLAAEDDDTFRQRIKNTRQSRAKGTALAITTNVQGIVATDENKRLSSSAVVVRQGFPTTLFIDDGTGYEEAAQGVPLETLMDVALGGEQYFQVSAERPVAKAFVISANAAPFSLSDGSTLAVSVGGSTYEHTFDPTAFRSIGNATAYEVVSALNGDPALAFSAATSNGGTQVRLFAKADTDESLEVVAPVDSIDANAALLFAAGRVDTMRLYKNDQLLSKDGNPAVIHSQSPSLWGTLTSGMTLTVAIDGTGATTYTFTDQDFIDANTGYSSVGVNSLAAWATVLNRKVPGITAVATNGVLEVSSNVGNSSRAEINISGGTLVTAQMFVAEEALGADNDYQLDRNTGQIRLETPLVAGDSLSIGTLSTRAFVQSQAIPTTAIASGGGKLWFSVDGSASRISTGLGSTSILSTTVSRQSYWGNRVRLTADTSAFTAVQPGDWMICFDPALVTTMKGIFRVAETAPTYVEIERRAMMAGRRNFSATVLNDGRILVVGGETVNSSNNGVSTQSCEIYDPGTSAWTPTGSMSEARRHHAAILMPSTGKVLVVGGQNISAPAANNAEIDAQYLLSCEIWDPSTGTWTAAASLPTGQQRRQMFADLMVSPTELPTIAGGNQTVLGHTTQLGTCFQYNSVGNTWTARANMATARSAGVGLAYANSSKLLAAGGMIGSTATSSVNTVESFDSVGNAWTTLATMGAARRQAVGVLLASGKVLVTGGFPNGSSAALSTAEVFNPAGPSWASTTGAMTQARASHAAAVLSSDLVTVGFGTDGSTNNWLSAETYDPGTGLFTATSAVNSTYQRLNGVMVTVGGNALMIGGSESASSEIFDGTDWIITDGGVTQGSFALTQAGIQFVRSSDRLQEADIATGAAFTAKNFSDSIGSQVLGASASTFRTNKLRVTTNSYEIGGDIAMVAADAEGQKLLISSGSAVENLSTHLASAQSGNTQAGTPEFSLPYIYGVEADSVRAYDTTQSVKANSLLVGLRSYDDLYDSSSPLYRQGNNVGFISSLSSAVSYQLKEQILTPRLAAREWVSRDRFYAASALAIGPSDDMTVVIDGDVDSLRFTVPLHRALTTVGTTYASQNTFKDGDNGGSSLAAAFGLGYDFNDFAVYMKSRGKTHSSDSTKTVLWRYSRPGPDGDRARVSYGYPQAAASAVSVSTTVNASKYTDVRVLLPSSALKTGYSLRNTSQIDVQSQGDSSGLFIINLSLGFPVASATRTQRIDFNTQTVNYSVGEVITGGSSGVTATIASIPLDAGTTGTLVITGSTGAFTTGENLTGGSGGTGKAVATQYYQVDLTLTLPTTGAGALMSLSDHSYQIGDGFYLNSTNVNFSSGLKTITARTATTLSYTGATTTALTATNIGTTSHDTAGEANWTGATPTPIASGDMIRLETTSGLPEALVGQTFRVGYLLPQTVQFYLDNGGGSLTLTTGWQTVDAPSIKFFGLNAGASSAGAIATAVNALAAVTNSIVPITGIATGAGTGVITEASYEENLVPFSSIILSDGVNYVQTTTSPGSLAGDYQLTFKNSINSVLASGSDWADEQPILVPQTVKNLVDWLNTLAVTGLSSVADIEAADQAQRLQITSLTPGSSGSVQIQGGSGNEGGASISGSSTLVVDPDTSSTSVATIKGSEADGLFAGVWLQIQNTQSMPKTVILPTTALTSWAPSGVMVFDNTTSSPLWSYSNSGPVLSTTWQVEKQGRYICISFDAQNPSAASIPSLTGVQEGDWVRVVTAVTPSANAVAVSSVNTGIYRVVRVEDGTHNIKGRAFWIENPNGVEERVEADISFYGFNSIMPGDVLSVSTDLWNSNNKGTWTVESVGAIGGLGAQFVNSASGKNTMKLVVSDRVPVTVGSVGALGSTEYQLVSVLEAQPTKLLKRIRTISPNQTDGTFVDLKFESSPGYTLMGAAAGSIMTPVDKLGFSADLAQGTDGYSHNTGLIAEANRVAYGDPSDSATYPGVVAAGAKLNVSGPLVKRITVAVNLRVRSGVSKTDVEARVKSAIASVINSAGIGESIAINDILAAAGKVNGVTAPSMISPVFTSENDLIDVQPFEKPLVLDLSADVLVSFAGQ